MANVNVDDVVSILSSPRVVDALQRPEFKNAIHKLAPPSYDYLTIWILIATAAVAAVGAILVWLQLRADHERSRRELAVSLIREWTASIEVETVSTVRFVRTLTREQCDKLSDRREFTLEKTPENLMLVKSCLENRFSIDDDPQFHERSANTTILISSLYCGYIRFIIARYLNNLESVMVAWYESVAQPSIIEGQFSFLRSEREADLATLRDAIFRGNNTDAFPCITRFVTNMQPRYGRRPGLADAWPFRIRRPAND